MENESEPILKINQNLILVLAIGASVLAIVLYYENKKMREQLFPQRQPCNCHEHEVTNQTSRVVYDQAASSFQAPIEHNADPRVMPNNQKPPEIVVD